MNSTAPSTRYEYIDALRGLAVLLVVITHCHNNFMNASYLPWIGRILGNMVYGVPLFYVISSYTLCHSSKNRMYESKYLINFFIRRVFRIAPMFIFALIVYLVFLNSGDRFWLYWGQKIDIFSVISSFFLMHGLHPSWTNSIVPGQWSIATEFSFYLIFPFIFSKLSTFRKTLFVLVPSFIFSQLLFLFFTNKNLISTPDLWNTWLYYNVLFQLPVFLCGILVFHLEQQEYKINFDKKVLSYVFILSFLFLLDVMFPKLVPDVYYFAVFFSVLLLVLKKNPSKIIVNKFLIYLGKISFSVYLFHIFVLIMFHKLHLDTFSNIAEINLLIRVPLILIITMFISSFSYKYIEIPFQKIGQRIISHHKNN